MDEIKLHPADMPRVMEIVMRRAYSEGFESVSSGSQCPYHGGRNRSQWESWNKGRLAGKQKQNAENVLSNPTLVYDGSLNL